jgi:hypothetical protein
MDGTFNYLGDVLLKDQLYDFAEIIRESFPDAVAANAKLSEKLDAFSSRANTWPGEVGAVYREREAPMYGSEDIVKLNTQNSAEILQVNGTRTEQKKTFMDQIESYKIQIQNSRIQLETRLAGYRKELASINASLTMYRDYPASVPNMAQPDHPIRLGYTRNSVLNSIQFETTRVNTEINSLNAEIAYLKGEYDAIRTLKINSHDRHWILKNENFTTGFHPLTGKNEKIVNNTLPTEAEIARLVCVHPETKCLNIPLTICCLIKYADKTGASDASLLAMLLMFLKKHCQQIYFAVNPKKSSLRSLIEALQLYCSCEEQISVISIELSKFTRHPGELFSESISKFDSLFTFLQQLKQPIKKDQLSILSQDVVQSIAPYLMESKCAKTFSNWVQECILLKRKITKQRIIEVVHKLESNSQLKLTSVKTIPAHFAQTQLGLAENQLVVAPTYSAQPTNLPRPSQRRTSGNRYPAGQSSTSTTQDKARSPSAPRSRFDKFNAGQRSPAQAVQKPRQEQRSLSGTVQGSAPRNRSTSNHSYQSAYSNAGSRNNSASSGRSLDSPHRALQKHTIFSKSSKRGETIKIPSQFRRDLTPKTRQFLNDTFFIKHANSEKFKNVMADRKCLRCFGNHFGNECQVYRMPCTILCRLCTYLYHPTEKCIHFNMNGTVKPASKN